MESFVLVTSVVGTHYVTDVEQTPTTMRQWFRTIPTPLTDPLYAFAWAADSALERSEDDHLRHQVWLVMDGVVTDFYDTHPHRTRYPYRATA